MFPHEPNVPGSIATALGLRESDCVLNCYYALIVAVLSLIHIFRQL